MNLPENQFYRNIFLRLLKKRRKNKETFLSKRAYACLKFEILTGAANSSFEFRDFEVRFSTLHVGWIGNPPPNFAKAEKVLN